MKEIVVNVLEEALELLKEGKDINEAIRLVKKCREALDKGYAEEFSNCCGASVLGESADGTGICAGCREHCMITF